MARIQDQVRSGFKKIKDSDLQQPLVVVIDMIHGFINEGALHDQAIAKIIPSIQKVLDNGYERVFFQDCHDPKAAEFESYPTHCLKDSHESEIVDALLPYTTDAKCIIAKNSTNGFIAEDWQVFMKNHLQNYQDIIVTGCCTDICILQFALGLRTWLNEQNRYQQRVIIPIDTVDTYHIEGVHDAYDCNAFALQNMQMNGIVVVSSIERG